MTETPFRSHNPQKQGEPIPAMPGFHRMRQTLHDANSVQQSLPDSPD